MIDNTWAKGPASGYIEPQPKGTEGVSATEQTNKLDKTLDDWWDSDVSKAIQKVIQENRQKLQ
jgi:hypothetical protein